MDTPAPPTEQESPPTSPQEYVETLAKKAKATAAQVATLSTTIKDRALLSMAEGLEAKSEEILAANEQDLESLGKEQETQALEDRLRLTPERIAEMAAGLREIAKLPDPLGQAPKLWRRPNGMQVGRVRVPIGVIGIIYESRPNVTADSAGLCLKSGNSCILRGGSEAVHSNTAIAKILAEAAEKAGVPANAIAFVERTEREAALALLKQDQYVDLIIPRGGESLMRTVTEQSTIPVIRHDKGVCHIYVDADADPNMAERICLNAKVQRPATCNAMETMLVHQTIARTLLPSLVQKLNDAKVEVRGCPRTCQLCSEAKPATENDYGAEFLSLTLAVKVVKNIAEAMEHIATFGSRHTEAIVTSDYSRAFRFLREVDASAVMVNASTRLNDGYQFGLGAEIGISTSRIHARGPMGLEELTCSKFIVLGSGQIRE
ncbi:MAG: glutamate-5-semialdehyde dehydrogenase [Nitrospiraceae bacterium]|nr:glutamate-5-semialdehyde dehydrogenase [Nitrospirota bacterium]MEC4688530.1 glutamate-5-semialdehyde dehydrogenase [Nitrospirota bacterium]